MAGGVGTDWLRLQARRISDGGELSVSAQEALAIQVESWLKTHSVEYAPPTDIPMSAIDEKKSRGNQARKDAIVADSVDRFAHAMRNGALFPPIVTFPYAGKLIIVDGNNRQAAARKAGLDLIFGIVISGDTPSELIQRLTVEANASHGVTPDVQWRLQQAFHLVSLGYTDVLAAEAAGVTAQQIQTARRVAESDSRARAMKISGFDKLPTTARGLFGALRDDPVFFQAARVAISTGMTIDEIREMSRMIKGYSSEGAKVEALGALAEERGLLVAARRASGKTSVRSAPSPKNQLVLAVGQLMKLDPDELVAQVITEADRTLILERVASLEEKLLAFQVALEQLKVRDGG